MSRAGGALPSERLGREGFSIVESVVDEGTIGALRASLSRQTTGPRLRGGRRNVLDVSEVREIVRSTALRALVEPVLGAGCFAVRALLFEKVPEANWRVAWHQDLAVAVRQRVDVSGFGPWTVKGGVPHALAPASVLDGMLALRVHLDECGEEDGPLRVLPGSHLQGRLSDFDIDAWKARSAPHTCVVGAGGVVLMRPLLLHASSSATRSSQRRVLHIEFAGGELPGGLEWAERV